MCSPHRRARALDHTRRSSGSWPRWSPLPSLTGSRSPRPDDPSNRSLLPSWRLPAGKRSRACRDGRRRATGRRRGQPGRSHRSPRARAGAFTGRSWARHEARPGSSASAARTWSSTSMRWSEPTGRRGRTRARGHASIRPRWRSSGPDESVAEVAELRTAAGRPSRRSTSLRLIVPLLAIAVALMVVVGRAPPCAGGSGSWASRSPPPACRRSPRCG